MNTFNTLPSVSTTSAQQADGDVSHAEGDFEGHGRKTADNADVLEITGGTETRPVRFKVRIADLDYYMAEPGPLDIDSCQFLPPICPVLKVPVVRVYGSNEAGQKTCLHIHQVGNHYDTWVHFVWWRLRSVVRLTSTRAYLMVGLSILLRII